MARFESFWTSDNAFTLPQGYTEGELRGLRTRHERPVLMSNGVWSFEVRASGAELRFKVKASGSQTLGRVTIPAGETCTFRYHVTGQPNERDVVRFIFSRLLGSKGVKYRMHADRISDLP